MAGELICLRREGTTMILLNRYGGKELSSKYIFLYPQTSTALGPHQQNLCKIWMWLIPRLQMILSTEKHYGMLSHEWDIYITHSDLKVQEALEKVMERLFEAQVREDWAQSVFWTW